VTVAPVPDLIADVMAAADPAAQRIATRRLEHMTPASGENFAAAIDRKLDTSLDSTAAAAGSGISDGAGHAQIINKPTGASAYRKFEAFILQMFVESMLPKDATDVFGKGTPGTVWRSMLAEQISNEMAKGNGIGIAKQLAKSRAAIDAAAPEG
jgi:hypothetical protein